MRDDTCPGRDAARSAASQNRDRQTHVMRRPRLSGAAFYAAPRPGHIAILL